MSDFLKNLEKAVNDGDFNSEAAKRINLIDEKANSAKGFTEKDHKTAEEIISAQAVPEEDVAKLNSDYEKKMMERAKEEIMMATMATLINMETEIDVKLNDLLQFIEFESKEFDQNLEINKELFNKFEELKNKYKFNQVK